MCEDTCACPEMQVGSLRVHATHMTCKTKHAPSHIVLSIITYYGRQARTDDNYRRIAAACLLRSAGRGASHSVASAASGASGVKTTSGVGTLSIMGGIMLVGIYLSIYISIY